MDDILPISLDQRLKNIINQVKVNLVELRRINQENKEKRQQHGQKECSRIINNFKRELLMKPGTILVKIVDKNILKEDDVIIYQREKNSPFIFGFYKINSEKFKEKDIFQFLEQQNWQHLKDSTKYGIPSLLSPLPLLNPTSMNSQREKLDNPEDELMLVEIKDLDLLELYHKDDTGRQYAPIIMSLNGVNNNVNITYFRVGFYYGSGKFNTFSNASNNKYYTFINEKQYNDIYAQSIDDPYEKVLSITTND